MMKQYRAPYYFVMFMVAYCMLFHTLASFIEATQAKKYQKWLESKAKEAKQTKSTFGSELKRVVVWGQLRGSQLLFSKSSPPSVSLCS